MFRPTAVMVSGCLVHNCIKMNAWKVMLLAGNITTGTLDFLLHSVALVIWLFQKLNKIKLWLAAVSFPSVNTEFLAVNIWKKKMQSQNS